MENRIFKIIGIILIAIIVSCYTAYGDETNSWDPLFELYHSDFGPDNPESGRLIDEYETILHVLDTLDKDCALYWNLASEDSRYQMECELKITTGALESVLEAITIFVNGHKGI